MYKLRPSFIVQKFSVERAIFYLNLFCRIFCNCERGGRSMRRVAFLSGNNWCFLRAHLFRVVCLQYALASAFFVAEIKSLSRELGSGIPNSGLVESSCVTWHGGHDDSSPNFSPRRRPRRQSPFWVNAPVWKDVPLEFCPRTRIASLRFIVIRLWHPQPPNESARRVNLSFHMLDVAWCTYLTLFFIVFGWRAFLSLKDVSVCNDRFRLLWPFYGQLTSSLLSISTSKQ